MFESPSLVLNSISEYLKSLISRNILKEFEIGISLFKYFSLKAVKFQSGFIYQYAFVMLIGFSLILTIIIIK